MGRGSGDAAPDVGHDQRCQALGGIVKDDQRATDREHLLLA